jgi:hypothetical protein
MHESLGFTEMDIAILYSMSKPSSSLGKIMIYYASTNRDRVPSREELERCMNTALAIEAMTMIKGKFLLSEEWFERLHQFDISTANEIDSLLEVTTLLKAETWECIHPPEYVLSQKEYNSALEEIKASGFQRLLGRNA